MSKKETKTVYVASDSSVFNKQTVEALMKEFQDFGYKLERNWLTEALRPEECLDAAVNADYMVMVNAAHSFGAMAEFGARVAAGKVAIVLDSKFQDYWLRHPLVYCLNQRDLFERLRQAEALEAEFGSTGILGL